MFENVHLRRGGTALLGTAAVLWIGCSDDALAPSPGPPTDPGTGSVRVITTTAGQDLDPDGYSVFVDGNTAAALEANASATFSASVGDHVLELVGVAKNCTVDGDNPRTVTVQEGAEVRIAFEVTCHLVTSIALVSGDAQQGEVGHLLAEPLVVRVTGKEGKAIEGGVVRWSTGPVAALEGRFDGGGDPVSEDTTRTNGDGLTEISVMPLAFHMINVNACVDPCEDSPASFHIDATDPGAALTLVSGGEQVVKAGTVGDPMVVRVTDGQGNGVPLVAVDWTVWLGEGALLGRFGEDGRGVDSDRARTDADGLARMWVTPIWFGPVMVDADAFGGGVQHSPVTFRIDATDLGAGLTAVSGDGQDGKAGEALREPFVVRVHDGRGDPVPNIRVFWSVEGGSGTLGTPSFTDANGEGSVVFSPRSLGAIRVIARLPGLPSTAAFTTDVRTIVIGYQPGFGGWPNYFVSRVDGWSCDWTSCWVYVPVGTPVEWVSHVPEANLVSTAVPAGGASIDSGVLDEGERFLFIPAVAGTWDYTDRLAGARGSLIVY